MQLLTLAQLLYFAYLKFVCYMGLNEIYILILILMLLLSLSLLTLLLLLFLSISAARYKENYPFCRLSSSSSIATANIWPPRRWRRTRRWRERRTEFRRRWKCFWRLSPVPRRHFRTRSATRFASAGISKFLYPRFLLCCTNTGTSTLRTKCWRCCRCC